MLRRCLRYPYAATRARAQAAGFLHYEDFAEIARLPNAAEALSRLRRTTAFHLEFYRSGEGLARDFLHFGRGLARTLSGADRALVEGYLGRVEVENLKVLSRGLLRKRADATTRSLLLPDGRAKALLPERLRTVRSFEELAAALPRRPYGRIFRDSLELPAEKRLFPLESGLDRAFWSGITALLERLAPLDRLGAGNILSLRADIDCFNVIHRGLQIGLDEGALLAALPPLGGAFPPDSVKKALRASSPAEVLAERFPVPGVTRPFSPEGEVALRKRLTRHLRRVLRSHPFDISIPLATLLLKEIEIQDLEVVLNGLRLDHGGRIGSLLTAEKG